MVAAEARAQHRPDGPVAVCSHLCGGSLYWIEGEPIQDPDSDCVARIWVCPECVEYDLSTLRARGNLALVAAQEVEWRLRRDEMVGARILPWTGDDVCESCAARTSLETPAPRLAVVPKPERQKKRKRRK
jgi:hypothetical protein